MVSPYDPPEQNDDQTDEGRFEFRRGRWFWFWVVIHVCFIAVVVIRYLRGGSFF